MSTMAEYAYRAIRLDGAEESGILEAASHEAAAAVLTDRKLFPIDIRPHASANVRASRMSAADLALGLSMLATLLESGLPTARALSALDEIAPGSWHSGLSAVSESVRQGNSLGIALRDSPLAIPPVLIGIIRAGEAGSGVSHALRRAAEWAETSAALRAGVRNALAYPFILAIAGTGSVVLMVTLVLPRFAAILADIGQTLPASTRIVLSAADVARTIALPGLVALFFLFVAYRVLLRNEEFLRQRDALLLSLPVIGRIRFSSATARACAALAALLSSGVRIAPALRHVIGAVGDTAVAARLAASREAIVGGSAIASALQQRRSLTPTGIRLVRAGEQSGRLAQMLDQAARLESERTRQMLATAVRLLEPALILAFSGIVALVAASLLQAVYSVRPVP